MRGLILDISIQVSANGKSVPIRCAMNVPMPLLSQAMRPRKTNDSAVGTLLDEQTAMEAQSILDARRDIAGFIANDIADYLVDVEFARLDTHNGYSNV